MDRSRIRVVAALAALLSAMPAAAQVCEATAPTGTCGPTRRVVVVCDTREICTCEGTWVCVSPGDATPGGGPRDVQLHGPGGSFDGDDSLQHDPDTDRTDVKILNLNYYFGMCGTTGSGTEADPWKGWESCLDALMDDCGLRSGTHQYPVCGASLGPGVYACTYNCLGQWTLATEGSDHAVRGVLLRGAGTGSTILRPLDTDGNGVLDPAVLNSAGDFYFFDQCDDETCAATGASKPKPIYWTFEGIRFEGRYVSMSGYDKDIPRGANGFRIAGEPTQGLDFRDCQFSGLNDAFQFRGGNQGSEFNFFGGAFLQVYTAFRFDNAQSLNTTTYGTDFDGIRGDMIVYESGGGGGIKMYGGFVSLQNLACQNSDCTGPQQSPTYNCLCCTGVGTGECPYTQSDNRWVLRSTANAGGGSQTSPTLLSGIHFELHGDKTGLAILSGSPNPQDGSNKQLHVQGGSILHADISADKDLVRIGNYAFVHLDGVHFPQLDLDDDDGDGFFESWKATFTATSPLVRNGVLKITDSELSLLPCAGGGCDAAPYPYRISLLDNVMWAHANKYGLLCAEGGNRGPGAGTLGVSTGESFAFSVMRGTPGTWETSVCDPPPIHWLGPVDDWPRDSAGSDRELTLWMPEGYALTGIRGFQDAATNCTEGFVGRYHVGTNDKTEKLASTWRTFRSEQQQLNTTLYRVLDTTNERRLRFWAEHGGVSTQECKGDYVTIEGN